MDKGTFMDIVGVHYKDIKQLFISRDLKKGLYFNEDSFNTAFIKCVEQYGNDIIEYDDVIKYFYVAYKHTRDSELLHNKKFELCEEFEDDDIIEENYDSYAEEIYEIVMNAVKMTFGDEDMMIYSLYKYHNWSKEDLENEGYDCFDFDKRIDTIHRFVIKYCKKNIK